MIRKYINHSLRLALSLAFICPPVTLVAANPARINTIDYSTAMKGDPIWDQFVAGEWSAPQMGRFKKNDPLLDSDPYFFRTQKWSTANATNQTRVETRGRNFSVQIAESRKALEFSAPLLPLFESSEFLFFKANHTDVFGDKAADASSYGEGLFFIDKALLTKEASRTESQSRPVPVFYLPLSGTGWTTEIQGIEISDTQIVAFKNAAGESASIDLDDLRNLSKVYQNNIVLSAISVLRHQTGNLQNAFQAAYQRKQINAELPFVFPAPGSTALFGTFFTGVNLDEPSHSLPGTYASVSLVEKLFPTAQASDLLTPDVLDRLIIVGQISSTVFVTSVLAKYTVLKERNRDRRALIESEEDKIRLNSGLPKIDRTTLTYKAKREGKEWIDYFSHGLSTISSAMGIAGGYILEYGADHLWRPDSKINRGVRKFLEYTFVYNRRQNENILVNAQTFFLGVLILGGIDTAGVVLQLLFVSPVFFPWVANLFGDRIHDQVTSQFSGKDASSNNLITSEIMRNLSAYGVSGAYSYSASQRQKIMEDIKPVIEAQMRREGKNPYDQKNETELDRRTEAVIERMLTERGLPSSKEFLFGAPTLIRSIAHFMGYKVDRTKVGNDDEFILEKARWGLISHALKRAQKTANDVFAASGNKQVGEAVRILSETKTKYSVFTRMIKRPMAPIQNIKDAYEVRKMLTVLSYEGEMIGGTVKYLDIWSGTSPDPASVLIAARLFRQALFSLIQNKPFLLQPNKEQMDKFYVEASREADSRLSKELEKSDASPVDKQILQLEIVKEKIIADQNETAIKEWQPKMAMLEKHQMEQAHLAAMRDLGEAQISHAKSSDITENSANIYREAYRRNLTRMVGIRDLSPEKSELVRLALEAADQEAHSNLTENKGLARYYAELNDIDKLKYASHLYANAYLDKYTQMTVSNSSIVTLNSPEQPGAFQRLRQTSIVSANTRVGKLLTAVLRTAESLGDNAANKPGLDNWLKRYIPLYGDFKAGAAMRIRTLVPTMTFGYLANYYLWQVRFPWDTLLFFTATCVFTSVVNYWLDRMMINNGIRPMDTTADKVKYSLLYTWLSYPTYIPFFFFLGDWKELSQSTQNAVTTGAKAIWNVCEKLLTGG